MAYDIRSDIFRAFAQPVISELLSTLWGDVEPVNDILSAGRQIMACYFLHHAYLANSVVSTSAVIQGACPLKYMENHLISMMKYPP